MKTEEHIKTVFKCSHCGADITCIRYKDIWCPDSLSYRTTASYECHKCGHADGEYTVVKEKIVETVTRPYTNEELKEMIDKQEHQINELYTMVDQLARGLSDHKQGIDR